MKKVFRLSLRFAVSISLMTWLFSRTGTNEIFVLFHQVPASLWMASATCYAISQFTSAARWRLVAQSLGFHGSYLHFLKIYFTGMFFNLFMPTSIGGDLLKAIFLGEKPGRRMRAGYSVFMDRVAGMTGLFILGTTALIFSIDRTPPALAAILTASTAAGITILAAMALYGHRLKKIMPGHADRIETIMHIWDSPWTIITAIIMSLLVQIFNIASAILIGFAMNIEIEPIYYYVMFPLVGILSILPVSIGGFGVREGSMACLLSLKQVPESSAVALSLAWFTVQAVIALAGGIIYVSGWHRK